MSNVSRAAKYRKNNPEKCRESQNKWYLKNIERRREYTAEWKKKNKEKIKEQDRLRHKLNYEKNKAILRQKNREWYYSNKDIIRDIECRRKYGVGLAEKDRMYKEQDGKCAICRELHPLRGERGIQIDHCHKTGVVRGLLCSKCNRMLSNARDDVNIFISAIKYLGRYGGKVSEVA